MTVNCSEGGPSPEALESVCQAKGSSSDVASPFVAVWITGAKSLGCLSLLVYLPCLARVSVFV